MAEQSAQQPKAMYPRWLQPIISRPYLITAILVGVLLYFITEPWLTRNATRVLVGWNGGVLVFLVMTFFMMKAADLETVKRRALAHDEGSHLILFLTIIAAIASVGALVGELSTAKGNLHGAFRVALASGTVILSWLFTQIVFAMHYAHSYYLAEEIGGPHKGGLEFGDDAEPDYWDFVHFSIIMGATAQTADIIFRSKQMRRIGTMHTLVAFGFNTAILATMINLAASVFS